MWAHLIHINFDFNALIEGWFKTLHKFDIWSYSGHTSPNNTHNNATNAASISFNSYQFLGGRLGSAFFIWSAYAWVLFPCDSDSASSLLIYSSIFCVVLGITINGEIPLSALSYISTGPSGLNFVFAISSIASLTKGNWGYGKDKIQPGRPGGNVWKCRKWNCTTDGDTKNYTRNWRRD